jgi:hypothetical protein
MSDVTDDEEDEEDEDWVIEEYIRIPASYMAVDVSPTEVGVLVLDEDQDSSFFFGPEQDDDDEWAEDEEDENGTCNQQLPSNDTSMHNPDQRISYIVLTRLNSREPLHGRLSGG